MDDKSKRDLLVRHLADGSSEYTDADGNVEHFKSHQMFMDIVNGEEKALTFFGFSGDTETDALREKMREFLDEVMLQGGKRQDVQAKLDSYVLPFGFPEVKFTAEMAAAYPRFGNIPDLVWEEAMRLVAEHPIIHICRNCGKYYTATRSNKQYCDNIPNGEKRPCTAIGPKKADKEKEDKDPAIAYIRRADRKMLARCGRGSLSREGLLQWRRKARVCKRLVHEGGMTQEELEETLST